jgi:two-component system sensor histidine kinase KdpD
MWVADRVDEGLQRYREDHGISDTWETKERVVVAITGAPGNDDLIRRAARMATRSRGELLGVHVRSEDGLADHRSSVLERNRDLLKDLGGAYHEVAAGDVADALVKFATSRNATQIVLGASNRSRWAELTGGSVINDVVRRSNEVDVHVISQPWTEDAPGPGASAAHAAAAEGAGRSIARRTPTRWQRLSGSAALPRRRLVVGWMLAVGLPLTTTLVLSSLDRWIDLPATLLTYTLVVTVVAVVGGILPATLAATSSFLLVNWFFTPPVHTWTVGESDNVLALLLFLADAIIIGMFVTVAGRRAALANAARADAETLAAIAGTAISSEELLATLVGQMRSALGATTVAVLRPLGDAGWAVEAWAGTEPQPTPEGAEVSVELSGQVRLLVDGAPVGLMDGPVFRAFCAQLAAALDREQLRVEADRADRLEEANELRAGLLAAVSHDLRTPLTAIKAAASTLHQPGVKWSPELQEEFLGEIITQADRLTTLVDNLLEMGRIQAGAVQLHLRPVSLDEAVGSAVIGLDLHGAGLAIDLDESLPRVMADAPLLERVLANLIDNALKWSPTDATVRIDAAAFGSRVTLRVVDRGPGIARDRRDEVFHAFQRLDDSSGIEGTGLGLAVAHGFITLMGGEIMVEDTPGGGTTMVVVLPRDGGPTVPDSPVSEDLAR